MAENNFKCSGNCLNCPPAQRTYCASQHSYSNMKVLDRMMDEIMSMRQDQKKLAEKIEAIQNSEANIFDPNTPAGDTAVPTPSIQTPLSNIAQKGDGAE